MKKGQTPRPKTRVRPGSGVCRRRSGVSTDTPQGRDTPGTPTSVSYPSTGGRVSSLRVLPPTLLCLFFPETFWRSKDSHIPQSVGCGGRMYTSFTLGPPLSRLSPSASSHVVSLHFWDQKTETRPERGDIHQRLENDVRRWGRYWTTERTF